MASVTYDSAAIYIDQATDLQDKINRMDQVISALMTTALNAASTANFSEYQLNDGQTVIKTVYRTVEDIQRSIMAFERLRQMYVNRLNGRAFRLVDSKNFYPNVYTTR